MNDATIQKVLELDERYFGRRPLPRLIRAMAAQVEAMQKTPTRTNVHKQLGDLLFIITSVARNNGWTLEELLGDTLANLENRRSARHYYEAHVTIEPVFEDRLQELTHLAEMNGFRVATLLMQQRPEDTPERSKNDAFCTARGVSYSDLLDRTLEFVALLREKGFTTWRYKIESTLLDSRYDDSLAPLDRASIPQKERDPLAPADGALAGRREA